MILSIQSIVRHRLWAKNHFLTGCIFFFKAKSSLSNRMSTDEISEITSALQNLNFYPHKIYIFHQKYIS